MKFTAAAVFAAAVSGAMAYSNVTYVTEVVNEFTTYCPEPTTLTYSDHTYTITEATTLTITGPCTITRPVTISTVVSCHACNHTTAHTPAPTGGVTHTPTGGATPVPTAGASKMVALSGAGLAGLLGIAALL